MADDMKFGPEWLRALTDGNNVTSPPPSPGFVPKYKLAEHRYGREEMLALFVPNSVIPENLKQFPSICVDKVQHPLAFVPLSDDEQRLMSQGVNSSAVLRMMGRGGSVPRGGRGGGERGRGRGRGRGEGFYSVREYDDNGYGRGRASRSESWEESRGEKRFERPGFSRGFPEDGATSPRKEFSRSMSTDNWRDTKREGEENDDGNWRRAGPKERNLSSRVSWRENRGFEKDYGTRYDERGSYERSYNRNRYKSTGSYEEEEELPEWSMADTEENIGTFDSSGAFMSLKELEEREYNRKDERDKGDPRGRHKDDRNKPSEVNHVKRKQSKEKTSDVNSDESSEKEEIDQKPRQDRSSKEKIQYESASSDSSISANNNNKDELESKASVNQFDSKPTQGKPPPEKTVAKATKGKNVKTSGLKEEDCSDNKFKSSNILVNSSDNKGSISSKKFVNSNSPLEAADNLSISSSPAAGGKAVDKTRKSPSTVPGTTATKSKVQLNANNTKSKNSAKPSQNDSDRKSDTALKKINTAVVSGSGDSNKTVNEQQKVEKQQLEMSALKMPQTAIASMVPGSKKEHLTSISEKLGDDPDFGHLDQGLENLVATVTEDDDEDDVVDSEKGGELAPDEYLDFVFPLEHEHAHKWFYRDPQGEVQGPFSAAEMAEWFSAGYFTMNLMVKRGCDDKFFTLGELIKRWGRVPFLPGSNPPPIKSNPVTVAAPQQPAPVAVASTASVQQATVTGPSAAPTEPQMLAQQEQLKAFLLQQQQAAFLQQQVQQAAVLRQLQMQQTLQVLQQKEAWAKMTPQQQQQVALQLMLKQQQQQGAAAAAAIQQQQAAAAQTTSINLAAMAQALASQAGSNSSGHLPTQQQAAAAVAAAIPQPMNTIQQQQAAKAQKKPQGNTAQGSSHYGSPAAFFQRSLSVPADDASDTVHRSSSQPRLEDNAAASIWGALNNPPASGAWSQPASVWDIEQSGKAKSLEEIEREELAKAQKEKDKRDAEHRKKKEEERKKLEELERQRKMELERQREMERLAEMEKQRHIELEKQRLAELEKQRIEKLKHEREEAERRQREAEEQRRHLEEENRRQQQLQQEAELKRHQQEEERRRQEEDRLEKQRAEEIRRRQEKAEELRRQQHKEALFRMQQEQMANIQLPQHAQWGSSPGGNAPTNSGITMQQIQEIEAEKQRREEAELRDKKIREQQEQLDIIRQQQEKATLSWAQRSAQMQQQPKMKSLLEIQQEQARAHLEDMKQKQTKGKQQATSMPLGTAAAWSGVNPATWAQEGVWGNSKPATPGFWDDPAIKIPNNKQKTAKINNAHFPALNPAVNTSAQNNKQKQSKIKKEEETVQRLFQSMMPKDDFTKWCENALKGFQTSVDVPTFIGFLSEVESPYEVHDYARQFLGESRETTEFAKQFIEKRIQFRSKNSGQREDTMWGPAPAVNPNQRGNAVGGGCSGSNYSNNNSEETNGKKLKKPKKMMQRVDNSILGFTCTAATERVNVGEIDNL